ncbi:hypothetical protein [Paenibacillus lutrae]|uniref:Uncharacterized protein n=1 Tax=Paenibacillus lutrae TaxID=2078573 RepID=A0A7X3K1A8_9BACL|nr:hypothetical protein [Paenibacillus lutrae]MVP02124.1 hypothetical protein [Paenibacillus lutrae]
MDFIIKVAFALIIFIMTWLFQEQNQQWDLQRNFMKGAVNSAVHDAALEIDDIEKSKGRLIIQDAIAWSTFTKSLQDNLGLDASLNPRAGSHMRHPVKIIYYEKIDEDDVSFPYLYDNPTYKISKYLSGPAIVAVIETPHPVMINRPVVPEPMRIPAIYEYKPNKI